MSIPGAFGVRPTDDLRQYMRAATLPIMRIPSYAPKLPLDNTHSHQNFLKLGLGGHRRLEGIDKLYPSPICAEQVRSYLSSAIRDGDIGAVEKEDDCPISVPASGFDVSRFSCPPPRDIELFSRWLESGPLQTVQNLAHCVFSDMDHWAFTSPYDHINGHLMRAFAWNPIKGTDEEFVVEPDASLMIFTQPPWVLTPRDVASFCECTSISHAVTEKTPSRQKVWAQIYDFCSARRCQYFILTNYTDWVFGVFTPGHTKAFICATSSFDDADPTVIELIFYWLASSLCAPGSFTPPEIPELVYTEPIAHIPPSDTQADAASISSWGTHHTVPSDAGVCLGEFRSSPEPDPGLLRNTAKYWTTTRFTVWVAEPETSTDKEEATIPPGRIAEDAASSIGSAWSTFSAKDIVGHAHWMAPHIKMQPIPRAYKAPPSPISEEPENEGV